MVTLFDVIFVVDFEENKEEGCKSDFSTDTNDVEKDKEFDINEATRGSTIVETSDNPYYVSADLNALEVSIRN